MVVFGFGFGFALVSVIVVFVPCFSRRGVLNLYPKLFYVVIRLGFRVLLSSFGHWVCCFFTSCTWDLFNLAYRLCLGLGIKSKRRSGGSEGYRVMWWWW